MSNKEPFLEYVLKNDNHGEPAVIKSTIKPFPHQLV